MNGIDRRSERLPEHEPAMLTTGSVILLPTSPPPPLCGAHPGMGALPALYDAAYTGGLFPETNGAGAHRSTVDSWPRGGQTDITVGTRPVRGDASAQSAPTSRRPPHAGEEASGTTIRFEDVLKRRLAIERARTSNPKHHRQAHVRSTTENSS